MRSFVIPVTAGLILACQSAVDSETSTAIEEYDMPGALAAFCHWEEAEFGAAVEVNGTLHHGDEHIPDFFEADSEGDLPEPARNRLLVVAFKKGEGEPDKLFREPVRIIGRLVHGDLTCRGNFSSETFSAVLLIDHVIPLAPRQP